MSCFLSFVALDFILFSLQGKKKKKITVQDIAACNQTAIAQQRDEYSAASV